MLQDPEDDIIDVDSSEISLTPSTKVRPVKPKKPTKVIPKQEFKTPLPPSISDQFQQGQLKFDTSPFRETPTQFMLRSTPPEKLDPPQRLLRERSLAARGGRTLDVARPQTPKERDISARIQRGQEIYDKYGPGVFAIREGLGRLGTSLAEPFAVSGREFAAIPGDIQALFTGGLKERQAARDAWMEQYREPLGSGIVRGGYDPLRLGEALSAAAPLLLPIKGRGVRPILGTEPFRGGARVGVRPPIRRPNRLDSGEVPPPTGSPTPPLVPFRPTLPNKGMDPFDAQLGGANIAPYQGGFDVHGMLSIAGSPKGLKGQALDMSFDLLPALRPGQSPVMIVPQWMVNAATNIHTGMTEGVTPDFSKIPGILNRIDHFAPSPVHATAARAALQEIQRAAETEGLNSIALVSQEHLRYQKAISELDISERASSEMVPAEVASHETLHAGQYKAAEEYLGAPDIYRLYDKEWSSNHPVIQEAILKNPSTTPEQEAVERPAYVMGRQTLRKFKTTAEGVDFLFDSLMHLQDKYGPGALDIIEQTARISPGLEDVIPLARSMYESWQLERSSQRGMGETGVGELSSTSRSLSQTQTGGVESRTGEGGVGAVGGEASGISSTDRTANLDRFLEQSRVRVPVYHGTQSPTEITKIDPSKFDPDALYGPGFYTTQSSEIAAGEGGYADTERPSGVPAGWTTAGDIEPIGKPHAYKLHLDIRNPFDINAPVINKEEFVRKAEEWLGKDAWKLRNLFETQEKIRNSVTGHDLYRAFKSAGMDRSEVNEMLQEMGYDGITHIGGNAAVKTFDSRVEAELYAQETGGKLEASDWGYVAPGEIMPEQYTVKGHKVWIAFNPNQVKSATGNVGTFDPDSPEMALSEAPPIKEGDLVKVTGYSNDAEVTKMLPDDGVEVRFPDGTTDEFDLNQVTKVTPKATPKVQESNEKLKTLQDESIVRDISDKRQPPLPGVPTSPKLIAEPPLPPPLNPPLPGIGEEAPPLKKERITHEYVEMTTKAFKELLKAEGIKEDPTLAPFLQVRRALLEGKIQPKGFEDILSRHGMNMEQYTEELAETASEAGRVLQEYSELTHEDELIVRMMKENLDLAEKLIPAKRRMEAILRDIEAGQLGKNFLQRASGTLQQLILSDLSIAFRNAITTTGRIPIMAGTQSIGAWIKHVHKGKSQGKTLEQAMEGAREDAMIGLEASAEMIASLTPKQLRRFVGLAGRGGRERHREVITQLEKHFPSLHKELATPGFAPESLEEGKQSLNLAETTLKKMRVDVKNRDEMVKRFRVAEERFLRNSSKMGKALTKAGYPLDALMAPMNWSEMFFRRPMFYGYLNMRLRLGDESIPDAIKGMDLPEIIRQGKFSDIPEELLKDSIDEALYITHAYMPRAERGTAELNARRIILALNSAKIAAPATAVWFPRALYNGLKFAWETVPLIPFIGGPPLGMIRPTIKIFDQKFVEDPKTGKKIPVDPTTNRDYTKMASGIIGMVLYGLAEWVRSSEYGGPEWYQINTGKKGKNGEPIYLDVKGYMPLSLFLWMADLNRRMRKGLMGNIDYSKEMGKALLGVQNTPGIGELINSLMDIFGGEEGPKIEKAKVEAGRQLVAPFTKPMVNIRNAWASFNEEENRRKDLKGTGILGPAIDNIPWLRNQPLDEWTGGVLPTLPDAESMTQEGPIKLSEDPLSTMAGFRFTEGENFAGREWRRLGLYNKTFMDPDPDPSINRAQNQMFRTLVSGFGKGMENNPSYAQMSDIEKAAEWEKILSGDKGIATFAREWGLSANPSEANKRDAQQKSGMGPLQRKAYKIDELLKEMSGDQK